MSKNPYYICNNEWGDDSGNGPCDYAVENHKIPITEIEKSLDGKAYCPGKTQNGVVCGCELELFGGKKPPIEKKLVITGAVSIVVLVAGLLFWLIGSNNNPILHLEGSTVALSKDASGLSFAELHITNEGDGTLVVERADITPDAFAVVGNSTEKKSSFFGLFLSSDPLLEVEAKGTGILRVELVDKTTDMIRGELTLYSNGAEGPVKVELVANQDPWMVYKQLEQTSKILSQDK